MPTIKNVTLLLNCFCFSELQTNNDMHNILFIFHKDYEDFSMILDLDYEDMQLKSNVMYSIFKFIKSDIINIDTLNCYLCSGMNKYFNINYDNNKWLNIMHSKDFTTDEITQFIYSNYTVNTEGD